MRYVSPAAFRQGLEARLATQSRDSGIDLNRLRRRVVFERLLVRLRSSQPDAWVLKGGMALELRWRDRARATRDLDLVARREVDDGDELRALMASALEHDPDGDWFIFEVGEARALAPDVAGRLGWRLPTEASLAGRLFQRVSVDVVLRADEITRTEVVPLLGMLAFADLPSGEIEVVDRAQHFAEKLHALTRTYAEGPSTRVRDLVDLVMLIEDGLPPSADLLVAVRHIFDARRTHELPTELPDPPPDWTARYATLADELDVGRATVADAMTELRDFWTQALESEEI